MPTPDMFATIKNNSIRSPRFNVSSGTDWRVETERIVPRWVDSMQKQRNFHFDTADKTNSLLSGYFYPLITNTRAVPLRFRA